MQFFLLNLFVCKLAKYFILNRCYIPKCDSNSSSYNEDFVHFAIPNITDETGTLPNPCARYDHIRGEDYCGPNAFNVNRTVPCSRYVWDDTDFENTVVSEVSIKSTNLCISKSCDISCL